MIRIAIPAALRDTTKQLYGVQRELRENCCTKDAAVARQRAPDAVAKLRAMLERATRVANDEPSEPTPRELAALVGGWYRKWTGADYTDPRLFDIFFGIMTGIRVRILRHSCAGFCRSAWQFVPSTGPRESVTLASK